MQCSFDEHNKLVIQGDDTSMKNILILAVALLTAGQAFAQDATTAWRKVLQNCAKSDLIGKQSLFFGVSNSIGPGSVWRRANDRSIRLLFVLSDAFPLPADQTKIVKANNIASCSGSSSSKWDLKLGLPFSTGATPLTLDIGALLGQAKNVTVSVTGYALDDLAETNWKQAFAGLPADNPYSKELHQPDRLLAENAVKVTGLKATFNYKTDFSADVQAKYKGKSFTLGNSSTGSATGSSTASSTGSGKGSSTGSGAGSSTGSGTASSTGSGTGSSGTGAGTGGSSSGGPTAGSNTSSGGSAQASSCSKSNTSDTGNSGSNPTPGSGSSDSGVATLHIDLTSSRQITICADGPFYLIAAYSRLEDATPIGIAPTGSTVVLIPATLPANAVPASERKEATP
jgi:hypothetical protein